MTQFQQSFANQNPNMLPSQQYYDANAGRPDASPQMLNNPNYIPGWNINTAFAQPAQQPVQRAPQSFTPLPPPPDLPSIALPNGQNPNLGNGLTASQQAFANPNWMHALASKGGGMGPANNIGTATPLGGLPQAGQYAAPVNANFSNLALGPVQHAQAPNFNFQQQLQNFINSGLMR